MSSYLVWLSKENHYHAKKVDGIPNKTRFHLFSNIATFGVNADSADDAIKKAKENGFNEVTPSNLPTWSHIYLPEFMEMRGYGNKKDN